MEYWWKKAKLYELYIDKFAGNIVGLTQRLDYFVELGINTLHILPHYPSPMVDDGYDVSDYRGVRAALGTLAQFEHFLQLAHRKDIHVIVDLALNHTSQEHPWFIEARSSKTNPKRDYYLWSKTGTEFPLIESGIGDIKDKNWIPDPATGEFYFATYYPQQPDLNWDNPAVFDEMVDVMCFWAKLGVDGFRLDAVPHLIKREGSASRGLPETHALLKRIRATLSGKFPEVILLAEAHDSIEDTKKYFGDGDECHMAYHFALMEQMWLSLQHGDEALLQKAVADSFTIPENCQWAIFLRNHDEISLVTLPPSERAALVSYLDPRKLYPFQKGLATSMRLGSVYASNREGLRKAFRLLYSLPGSPIMYYGDEIGMQNLPHEESIRDSRRYVRGTFDWKAAEAQQKDPASLFREVADLIKGVVPQTQQAPGAVDRIAKEHEIV